MTQEQLTTAIQALQQVAARCEENIKTIFKRMDDQTEISKSVHQLAASVEVIANELQHMREDQRAMRGDIDAMQARPARHWDDVVRTTITVAVSVLAGYLLSALLGG